MFGCVRFSKSVVDDKTANESVDDTSSNDDKPTLDIDKAIEYYLYIKESWTTIIDKRCRAYKLVKKWIYP